MTPKILKNEDSNYIIYENISEDEYFTICQIALHPKQIGCAISEDIITKIKKSDKVYLVNKNPHGKSGKPTTVRVVHDIKNYSHQYCNLEELLLENAALSINAELSELEDEYGWRFRFCENKIKIVNKNLFTE